MSPTIQDVCFHTVLRAHGEEANCFITQALPLYTYSDKTYLHYTNFLPLYKKGGKVSDTEHLSFLIYWLNRFIFCVSSGLESSVSDTTLDKAIEKKTKVAHDRSRTTLTIPVSTISTRTRSKSFEDKKSSPEDLAFTPESIDKPFATLPRQRRRLKKYKPFVDSSPSREATDFASDQTLEWTPSEQKVKAKESMGTEKGASGSPVSRSEETVKDEAKGQGLPQTEIQTSLSPVDLHDKAIEIIEGEALDKLLETFRDIVSTTSGTSASGVGSSIQPSISSDDASNAKESLKTALKKNLRSTLHHGRASKLKEIMKTLIEAKALAPTQDTTLVSFYKEFPSLLDAFDNASLTNTLNQKTEDWKDLKVRIEGVRVRDAAKKRVETSN
ncbi:hypothetical protein Vadar_017855 [Vaccinium darrowii]|uniref:Uncharacterized protein n=1 Tax=Vaccinium darrowii TaxID=229202 RepID=A0ACB7XJ03_9ERIC|nr:hypothetical protein Vadar_017855 [Vaccinium darrowii]